MVIRSVENKCDVPQCPSESWPGELSILDKKEIVILPKSIQ